MVDLFDFKYPKSPGFKEATTSKDAAAAIAPRAPSLRDAVLKAMRDRWPSGYTADEVAAVLGKSELAIRPRLSELRKTGDIIPTEIRRPNDSGVMARVWAAKGAT